MSSSTALQNIEKHIPIVGNVHTKSPIAYRATRLAVSTVNALQMAAAESYINGLEVPDSVLRSLFDTCMPLFFKYFPSACTLRMGTNRNRSYRRRATGFNEDSVRLTSSNAESDVRRWKTHLSQIQHGIVGKRSRQP
ncbi:MAG: hypothetical protein WBL95_05685 [Microcoleus sp.]